MIIETQRTSRPIVTFYTLINSKVPLSAIWRSAQRVALREITVDTLASTLTRRGRHERDRLVTLRREKQGYFSEKKTMKRNVPFSISDQEIFIKFLVLPIYIVPLDMKGLSATL